MAFSLQKAPGSPPGLRSRPIDPGPLRQLVGMLGSGMESAQVWPLVHTCGLSVLLSGAEIKASSPGQKLQEAPRSYRLAQGALEQLMAGDPDAPISAISRHSRLAGLINAAQNVICQPGWFLDPSQAVLVVADQAELDALMALLRQRMAGQGSDEDPQVAAQWVAENLMAPYPGWKFGGALPVRLASEIGPEDSWREVFLSPRCLKLPALEVLPAVRAARVGLHIPAVGGEDAGAVERKPGRQWDWEEQDRKQDRRLAELSAQSEEQYRDSLNAAQEARKVRREREAQREAAWRAKVGLDLSDLVGHRDEALLIRFAAPIEGPSLIAAASKKGEKSL